MFFEICYISCYPIKKKKSERYFNRYQNRFSNYLSFMISNDLSFSLNLTNNATLHPVPVKRVITRTIASILYLIRQKC